MKISLRICAGVIAVALALAPACAGQHQVTVPGGSFTMPVSADDVRRAAVRLADETRAAVNLLREARTIAQGAGLPDPVMDRIDRAAIAFFRGAEELGAKLADRTERAALVADASSLAGLIDAALEALSNTGRPRLDRWVEMIRGAWLIGHRLIGLSPDAPLSEALVTLLSRAQPKERPEGRVHPALSALPVLPAAERAVDERGGSGLRETRRFACAADLLGAWIARLGRGAVRAVRVGGHRSDA
jgi:hypothetical protein